MLQIAIWGWTGAAGARNLGVEKCFCSLLTDSNVHTSGILTSLLNEDGEHILKNREKTKTKSDVRTLLGALLVMWEPK